GVLGKTKGTEWRAPPRPTIYFNMFQENRLPFQGQFQLRTTGKPTAAAGPVQQIVRDVLKATPITRVTTLADQVDSNIVPEGLIATLSGCFGAIAVVLAGIGLSGLPAYPVTRRTNEIGVRMALGATTRDVNRLVLREFPPPAWRWESRWWFGAGRLRRSCSPISGHRAPYRLHSRAQPFSEPASWLHICRHAARPASIPWKRCGTTSSAALAIPWLPACPRYSPAAAGCKAS